MVLPSDADLDYLSEVLELRKIEEMRIATCDPCQQRISEPSPFLSLAQNAHMTKFAPKSARKQGRWCDQSIVFCGCLFPVTFPNSPAETGRLFSKARRDSSEISLLQGIPKAT